MAGDNGQSEAQSIAAAVQEISDRATTLIREEIELAKAEVQQKALKAFQDYEQSAGALHLAEELVGLRKESLKTTAAADQLKAGKDLLTAEVDAVKADLNHRIAYVKLMSLIGRQ